MDLFYCSKVGWLPRKEPSSSRKVDDGSLTDTFHYIKFHFYVCFEKRMNETLLIPHDKFNLLLCINYIVINK